MTATRPYYSNPNTTTPFSHWLRQREFPLDSTRISNHDLDYVWHNYREHWLILIEEKRACAEQTWAQKQTHGVLDKMLRMTAYRDCEYRGYYLIQFEKTTPDDSRWMLINGNAASKGDLLHLLRHGSLPDTDVPF